MSESRREDPFPIDPELRQLLREIAERQETRLLRVPEARSAEEAIAPNPLARATMPSLAAVERCLLLKYRNEVAALLGRLALARLHSQERVRRLTRVYVAPDERIEIPQERPARRRLFREGRAVRESYGSEPTALELLDAIQTGARRSASATSAARASLRLVPGDACRLYIAQELIAGGSPHAALRSFLHVADSSHLAHMKAAALSWQGVVAAKRGDYHGALEQNRTAREISAGRPNHSFNCLVYAMQAGLRRESLAEAVHSNSASRADAPALMEWLAGAYEGRAAGDWSPTKEGRELARWMSDELDPVSRRIAHVLL